MNTLKLTLVAFVLVSFAMVQGTSAAAASGYTLFGDATLVHPGNASNTAVQLRSDSTPGWGGVDFATPADMTVAGLTNLSTDYNFTEASCGGGAPRFQVNVLMPDGTTKNIFVYIGPFPSYTGCPMDAWTSTGNLVTPLSLVDASQLGGVFYEPWALVAATYGSYPVTGIQLVTDSSWFFGGATQTVLVDNVMINTMTYTFETNNKDSCKKGGWQELGFKNQGDCVSFFANGK